jgi:hypothetical protein
LAADDLASPASGPDGDLDDGLHNRGTGRAGDDNRDGSGLLPAL